MNNCKNRNCDKEVSGRRKYCSDFCKYWENQLKKDDDFGLPPINKRNKNYFYQYVGSSYPKGQGKRVAGVFTGALTGIPVANFLVKEFNEENLIRHFENSKSINYIDLCDGSRMSRRDVESTLKIIFK